ncbi:MAG: hypothetical protein JWL72_860, partial [Ilumatobacteraceae bacterium]|nr:hypothetical protein [Ilumatobacteraceae bacterium]MCU1399535.1 hypothetical protein [Acidimicrobiales bacterium]
ILLLFRIAPPYVWIVARVDDFGVTG